MRTWITAGVFTVLLASTGLIVSAATEGAQKKEQAQPKVNLTKEEAAFASAATLEKKAALGAGQKLCSVVTPNNWRDTINVPPGATLSSCIRFMQITGASTLQLGCIFSNGEVSLGPAGGGTPLPNCRW